MSTLAQKLQLKIYAHPAPELDSKNLVPVFHDWIKHHVLPELLVDVTSYDHVPEGPKILLVGHGSDYALDEGEGRLGLLYSRKRGQLAPEARLGDCFRRAVFAATLLEKEPRLEGKLTFRTDTFLFRINDRRLAPNQPATFEQIRPELEAFSRRLFEGGTVSLEHTGSPRQLFGVRIETTAAPPLSALLERLGGPPPPDPGQTG